MDDKKLIDLKSKIKNPLLRFLYGFVSFPLESFLGVRGINSVYYKLSQLSETENNFYDNALTVLDGSYEVDSDELKNIPANGPLIVVSNHPYGGLDGIVLGSVLLKVRPDVKLLANYLLGYMRQIKPWFLPVNPFGGAEAAKENLSAIKDTIRHIKSGGCMATFPSGTVSHFTFKNMRITDPQWMKNVAGIARKTEAAVLPIYFYGRNSFFFQLAGLINPYLRTMLLMRELLRSAKKETVKMRIGKPISPEKIAAFESDEELIAWMRLNTYALKDKIPCTKISEENEQLSPTKSMFQIGHLKKIYEKFLPKSKAMQDIILPISPEKMEEEIKALPPECKLLGGERIVVYGAYAWQMKWTMLEIGRLREKTFREVGEGTGKSIDTDEFDQYYMHIFMWDVPNKKIAGAYRVGHSDKIISSIGSQGLYTTTLFKIQNALLEKIGPALEMGRSFIVSEYQKKRSTLALLWRGIGEYLVRNPQYKTLYGPVSISTEYNALSKHLMVQFLSQHKTSPELAKFVKAKKPPKIQLDKDGIDKIISSTKDIERISALISEIEMDNKGIPVLLKHYLRLNGELLAFNVDKTFGNCIDGLIMVDMHKTDPKLLKSYMGLDGMIKYCEYRKIELSKEYYDELAASKVNML